MESIMRHMANIKRLFTSILEAGFVFVGFIVLVYLLLGADSGPYVASVIANISLMIDAVGRESLVALALAFGLGLALKRRL